MREPWFASLDDEALREFLRILVAVDEQRLSLNSRGRYEILHEERPDRKTREKLVKRGFLRRAYIAPRSSPYTLTAKGAAAIRSGLNERARRAANSHSESE